MTKLTLFALIIFCACGCATEKQWTAAGGSRADGTVKLSYEYGLFEAPKVSASQGADVATYRCKNWGYSGADAFGAPLTTCTQPNGTGGCNMWLVTIEYQCTGSAISPP